MNLTEMAAWWGAVVATLVLLWDAYKWKRSGPVLNVFASPDMQAIEDIANGVDGSSFVVVEVTNTGNQKTTITHLVGFHYSSLLGKIFNKNNKQFLVGNPGLGQQIPFVLGPGERWLGGIDQNDELEKMSRDGYLYCGVYHTSGKKPVLQRVVIKNTNAT